MIASACRADMASGFVGGVLDFVDCQAQSIGAGGFLSPAAPGSTLALILTAFLTLFVALFGYRMLIGRTPDLNDAILAAAKIGIVLALALSWPAYRTLVYDVALMGPAEMAAQIGRPAGLPGSAGGLVARLDLVDQGLVSLAVAGIGNGPPAPIVGARREVAPQQTASTFDPFAIGTARVAFLTGSVGALAAMRMIAALMLALGPFFAAFLLFEGTRGLFEGWIRVLAGAALAALGTAVLLGVELALLEPRLFELLTWRNAGYSLPGAPAELLVLCLIFALAVLAVIIASWRVTVGFGLPAAWRAAPAHLAAAFGATETRFAARGGALGLTRETDRSRAIAIASAVARAQHREMGGGGLDSGPQPRRAAPHDGERDHPAEPGRPPLGQSDRRRTRGRLSASARRRDQGE